MFRLGFWIVFVFCNLVFWGQFLLIDFLNCKDAPKIDYQAIFYFSGDGAQTNKIQPISKYRLDKVFSEWSLKKDSLNIYILINGHGDNPKVVLRAREYLKDKGVPLDRFILEEESRNTWENIKFAIPKLKALGIKRLLLVSSPYHISRIMRYIEKQKIMNEMTFTWAFYDHHLDNKKPFFKFLQILHELVSVPRDVLFYGNSIYSKACYE